MVCVGFRLGIEVEGKKILIVPQVVIERDGGKIKIF